MISIRKFLKKRLKLKVNEGKSAVARFGERKFLGYRITSEGRLQIEPASIDRIKQNIRSITKRTRGVSPGKAVANHLHE